MFCGNRRKLKDESGQTLVFAILTMVVLIAMAGFAIDVGHAYVVQRQLQAATDAAALAGALDLPDSAAATQTANDYGPAPGKRNPPRSNDNAAITVETKCVTSIPGCSAAAGTVNAISVQASSDVETTFAKVLGFNSFTVHATATACSPCSVKPLDIMVVLDRTGSMCQFSNGSPDAACSDLKNARDGIKTFLGLLNPQYDKVGLAVLPPATGMTRNDQCSPPTVPSQASYDSPTAQYLIAPLSFDYATSPGNLNTNSVLVDRVNCQLQGGGRTGYANSIDAARTELQNNGRTGVQKVIVFLSDGAANYGPLSSPPEYRNQPCQAGVDAARQAKSANISIYTIGYDLDGINGVYEACQTRSNTLEVPNMDARQAMERIASDPSTFYQKNVPGRLDAIFMSIAADIFRTAQLIDDSTS